MNNIQIDAETAGTMERLCPHPWTKIVGLVLLGGLLWTGTARADVAWCDAPGAESAAGCEVGACDRGIAGCDSLGCDSLGCDLLGGNLMTGWSVRADALFLHRERPDNKVLAFNTNNAAQALNAESFDLGVHTGFDVAIARALNCTTTVELRYFGFDH